MVHNSNIDKLINVKKELAEVYKDEVVDDVYDNGNLAQMNNAIMTVEGIIESLKTREPQ